MSNGKIMTAIQLANFHYTEQRRYCENIKREIQPFIQWDKHISVEFTPAEGLCVSLSEDYLVPIGLITHLIESKGIVNEEDIESSLFTT